MFKIKDSVYIGFLIGLIIPIVMYVIISTSMEDTGRFISISLIEDISLFLICLNAVIMNFLFFGNDKDNLGKGMFIVTGLYAIAYIVYFVLIR